MTPCNEPCEAHGSTLDQCAANGCAKPGADDTTAELAAHAAAHPIDAARAMLEAADLTADDPLVIRLADVILEEGVEKALVVVGAVAAAKRRQRAR